MKKTILLLLAAFVMGCGGNTEEKKSEENKKVNRSSSRSSGSEDTANALQYVVGSDQLTGIREKLTPLVIVAAQNTLNDRKIIEEKDKDILVDRYKNSIRLLLYNKRDIVLKTKNDIDEQIKKLIY